MQVVSGALRARQGVARVPPPHPHPSSLPTTFAWLDLGTAGLFLGQLQDGLKAFNLEIIFCH